jgi:2-deoxy-D-gluconate 3-dehydrogenase
MANPFDLSGRIAIVTGANTGIGQGIAVALAGAGAAIVAVGRSSMDETEALIGSTGAKFHTIAADLGSIAPVKTIVAETLATFGSIDILVNNAGIVRRADAIDFTEEDWDAVMNINLKTAFFLTQAAAHHMLEKSRGKVINVASMLSFQGGIRIPSYTAS